MRGGLEGGGAGGFRGLLTQGRASPCPQVGQDAAPPPSSPLGSDGRGDLERSLPQAKSSRAGSPRPAAPPGGPRPPMPLSAPHSPGLWGQSGKDSLKTPGQNPGILCLRLSPECAPLALACLTAPDSPRSRVSGKLKDGASRGGMRENGVSQSPSPCAWGTGVRCGETLHHARCGEGEGCCGLNERARGLVCSRSPG